MRSYVDLLAWAWILWGLFQGVIAVMIGLVFLGLGGGLAMVGIGVGGEDGLGLAVGGAFYGAMGLFVAVVAGLSCIPAVAAGFGLRRRANWARFVAIILGAIGILNMPLGTLLGVLTLVVLLDKDVASDFGATG